MLELVTFGKRRDDLLGQLFQSLNDIRNDEFFAAAKKQAHSFRADVRKTGNGYVIEAELPGFRKEEISIDYEGDYLTIKAERSEEGERKNDQEQVVRSERRFGQFVRRYYVRDIDVESIKASLKDGLLTLQVQNCQVPAGKKIEIQEG